MVKCILAVVFSVALAILAGCSKSSSPVSVNQPPAGVYYYAEYGMPTVFIWNGSSWRVGRGHNDVTAIKSVTSYEGDTAANLVINCTQDRTFNIRVTRLPITIDTYGAADSLNPFCGIYGSYDNSYIFAINDVGSGYPNSYYVTIINVTTTGTMGMLSDSMSASSFGSNPSAIQLNGHGWGEVTYNPIDPRPLTGFLEWVNPPNSIQLIGMDGCGL